VNIIPGVSSVYEWEGKINTDSEAGFADPYSFNTDPGPDPAF
jgi:hypothetical protein